MKKILSLLAAFGVMFYLSSCGDDDDPAVDNGVTISGVPATAEIDNLGTYTATVTLKAEDGLAALAVTKGGAAFDAETYSGEKTATYEFSYTAEEADADKNVAFNFTATDTDGDTGSFNFVLSVGEAPSEIMITENITSDVTWTSNIVYILAGRIAVEDGATLTIEAGTIIKGQAGSGSNATALVIARGGKLMAEGTAEAPIIFTSVADEIEPGMIASPNLDPDVDGLWGGLIVLGKAPISVSTNEETFQIEGIPASDINGLYGGNDPEDNSGVIRYVSIRHGGSNIGEGNEINGLTLGGVGSGTVVEYIEVVANQDDGIEWFGGTVNVTNALVWNSGDDALDTDQAWSGTMDNFVIIAGADTDHALEIDGPEGTFLGAHTLKNGSVKGSSVAELGDFRDGARGTFQSIYFFNFPDPAGDGRGDLSLSGTKTTDNFANDDLVFSNLEVTLLGGVTLTDVFKNGTDAHASSVASGANTVGADVSKFSGWSWAHAAGELADF
ncbi:hypothetical protein C900_04915 [Fulvivirga imtechensis AK7]|uniref:Uncharacterized protein n=1 Tax=Fulvivirga imtechensis AK7 TaxID=1237149 RepID=L8JQ70_9BACT|nr:hypothetical protein [Fulvivirga imtechensis]ELR69527.1 hypothetical protein C900_04915 [Fulvivirga imtechensis AK7]